MKYESFVVVGLGKFGMAIAKELNKYGKEIMAIDKEETIVKEASVFIRQAIVGDATDAKLLKDLGVDNYDVGIVSVGEDITASILITMALKECGIDYVVAKATSDTHRKILVRVGADRVIFPERDMGIQIGRSLASPGIIEYVNLSRTHGIVDVKAPKGFEGKSLRELNLRARFGVYVIAIKRKVPKPGDGGVLNLEEDFIIAPDPEEIISQGDILVLLGNLEDIEKMRNI